MTACRHFGVCGGCALQNLSPQDYRAGKRAMVVDALAQAGLGDVTVEEPVIVPPRSRRRAVFKVARAKGAVEIGFHAARSHEIVDMRECLVLTPALFDLTGPLRAALTPILNDGEKVELHATQTDSGLDFGFRWTRKLSAALTAQMAAALAPLPVARVIFNDQILLEQQKPMVRVGGADVLLPPQAFLQATAAGEAALQARVLALMEGAKHIADLFAGLGTFTLPLAAHARVHAVEQDGAALAALAEAARKTQGLKPVTTEKRDLFKSPLTPLELAAFDGVVLDPPRAGALAQARALAASKATRIAYVSCDAASFARDARILVDSGFVAGSVTPIDQFLFSMHIELVAGFTRKKAGDETDIGGAVAGAGRGTGLRGGVRQLGRVDRGGRRSCP
jgi:23S rRNA (uracil1939-C5)-methyltransferase